MEIEEKKEEEKSTEEDKKNPEKEESTKEETPSEPADFEKESDVVSKNKYNQAIRKQREVELEKKTLEKQLQEKDVKVSKPAPEKEKEKVEKKEDSFFDDLDDMDETPEEESKEKPESDTEQIVEEKLKPVMELLKQKEQDERKKDRSAFFEAHPNYLQDAEEWNELLDVLTTDINPNSGDTYIQQLEKAHILRSGDVENSSIADAKKDMARDASSGGDGAEKSTDKTEEFTAEDRKIMKDFGVSEEGMRLSKQKIKDGSMRIL